MVVITSRVCRPSGVLSRISGRQSARHLRRPMLAYREAPTLFFEFHGSTTSVAEQVAQVSALAKENGGGEFSWSNRPEERSRLFRPFSACGSPAPPARERQLQQNIPMSSLARRVQYTTVVARRLPSMRAAQ